MLDFRKTTVQAGMIVLLAGALVAAILIQRQGNQKELASQLEETEVGVTDDSVQLGNHHVEVASGAAPPMDTAPKSLKLTETPSSRQAISEAPLIPATSKSSVETNPQISRQRVSKELPLPAQLESEGAMDPQRSRQGMVKESTISTTPKSANGIDSRISRLAISKVKTREEAVELHRIITLRFLGQLEKFSSSTSNQARMRRDLEETADRYYLLRKVTKMHKMEPLGGESLLESERKRVEKLVTVLGYSTPAARAAEDAFSKFDLLNDEHIVHTLRKWLGEAPETGASEPDGMEP